VKLKTKVLRKILADRGITQRQLSTQLEVSEEFLSRLFAGKVNLTLEILLKISRFLGIKVETILEIESSNDFARLLTESTQKQIETINNSLLSISQRLSILPQEAAVKLTNKLKESIISLTIGGKHAHT
jgi:plasmid maintenance system antidote protein VapI